MSTLLHRRTLSRRAFSAGLALSPFAVTATSRYVAARQATPGAEGDIFRYTFGDAKVCLFDTETWDLSPAFAAANATIAERREIGKEFGPFTMSVTATLVDTGSHLLLMDTGPYTDLGVKVEQAGYIPADVEVITFSHLHYDHFMGAFATPMRDELAFPNARHVVSQAEYDYCQQDDGRLVSIYAEPNMNFYRTDAQTFLTSLGDQLQIAEWDDEILPGVRILPAIGHTGGHAAVEVRSGEETLLHVGDLVLNPILNLEHPDWAIAPAVWHEEDLASRRTLMDRAADEHMIVQTVHFPFPGVGYVEHDGEAWRWIPLE
jgi:glyoxylase-like metal-dependent hydrolase (beta-lactamase superfamily II)